MTTPLTRAAVERGDHTIEQILATIAALDEARAERDMLFALVKRALWEGWVTRGQLAKDMNAAIEKVSP